MSFYLIKHYILKYTVSQTLFLLSLITVKLGGII
jgi:hypothetical protein